MFFPPPPRPKDRFKWTDLHEAAKHILDREVEMEPEAFEAWLKERPGAMILFLLLVEESEGRPIEREILRDVMNEPMPEVKEPATIAELFDEKGRMPRLPWSPPSANVLSIAEYQQRVMHGVPPPYP